MTGERRNDGSRGARTEYRGRGNVEQKERGGGSAERKARGIRYEAKRQGSDACVGVNQWILSRGRRLEAGEAVGADVMRL